MEMVYHSPALRGIIKTLKSLNSHEFIELVQNGYSEALPISPKEKEAIQVFFSNQQNDEQENEPEYNIWT